MHNQIVFFLTLCYLLFYSWLGPLLQCLIIGHIVLLLNHMKLALSDYLNSFNFFYKKTYLVIFFPFPQLSQIYSFPLFPPMQLHIFLFLLPKTDFIFNLLLFFSCTCLCFLVLLFWFHVLKDQGVGETP